MWQVSSRSMTSTTSESQRVISAIPTKHARRPTAVRGRTVVSRLGEERVGSDAVCHRVPGFMKRPLEAATAEADVRTAEPQPTITDNTCVVRPRRQRRVSACSVIWMMTVLLARPPLAEAHHSFAAEFDATRPVTLRGVIATMQWVNPHTWIHLDVKAQDGTIVRWAIEGAAPNTLFRRGLNQRMLSVGTILVVRGFQARDGSHTANGMAVTLTDGRTVLLGAPRRATQKAS